MGAGYFVESYERGWQFDRNPTTLFVDPVGPSCGELDQAEVSKNLKLLTYLGADVSVERMGNL
jgi:hypothetical protein